MSDRSTAKWYCCPSVKAICQLRLHVEYIEEYFRTLISRQLCLQVSMLFQIYINTDLYYLDQSLEQ